MDTNVIDIKTGEKIKREDLQILIEQDKQDRAQKCYAELQLLLKKYNCDLDFSITLKTNQVIPNLQIVPK